MRLVTRLGLVVLGATWLGCSSSGSELEAGGYEERREAFFVETIEDDPHNTYSEVMRLERDEMPDESKIQHDLDRLTRREDTSDFRLPALLWMGTRKAFVRQLSKVVRLPVVAGPRFQQRVEGLLPITKGLYAQMHAMRFTKVLQWSDDPLTFLRISCIECGQHNDLLPMYFLRQKRERRGVAHDYPGVRFFR